MDMCISRNTVFRLGAFRAPGRWGAAWRSAEGATPRKIGDLFFLFFFDLAHAQLDQAVP